MAFSLILLVVPSWGERSSRDEVNQPIGYTLVIRSGIVFPYNQHNFHTCHCRLGQMSGWLSSSSINKETSMPHPYPSPQLKPLFELSATLERFDDLGETPQGHRMMAVVGQGSGTRR